MTDEKQQYEIMTGSWRGKFGIEALAAIVSDPGKTKSHYIKALNDIEHPQRARTIHLRINDLLEDGLIEATTYEGSYKMTFAPTENGIKVLELCRQIEVLCTRRVKE